MKKGRLLNSEISSVISRMGHKDHITVGDAGLPIPTGVKRIDLAVEKGVPTFLGTLEVILDELKVEEVVIAKEMKTVSREFYFELFKLLEKKCGEITIVEVFHDEFKGMTKESKAVVRTGECTPYANIILKSGVTF
ncbi:MAG: D-ribose pyranase [Psychrilyobacter sp.]|uniref:D-ribose pyranase n=1 Tax=Psychrilyobacter sp. TaxID=2586924 RepID=UPI003C73F82D